MFFLFLCTKLIQKRGHHSRGTLFKGGHHWRKYCINENWKTIQKFKKILFDWALLLKEGIQKFSVFAYHQYYIQGRWPVGGQKCLKNCLYVIYEWSFSKTSPGLYGKVQHIGCCDSRTFGSRSWNVLKRSWFQEKIICDFVLCSAILESGHEVF